MALSREEIIAHLEHPELDDELFERARESRRAVFGDMVFSYGFDYFSTYCRNACAFCLYRCGNGRAPRYRRTRDEVVSAALDLASDGVNLIDLTMGEDPEYLSDPEPLVSLVADVADATGLPVMVSPGVVDPTWMPALADAGATWLALYQETYDRGSYARLRPGQPFDARIAGKSAARDAGLLVEEGLLTGWGDDAGMLADSLLSLTGSHPSQVRVMTFVPQPGTPLEGSVPATTRRELVSIALLRLLYPDLLVPASLDVEGPSGLPSRLDAGANVITSIVPPGLGLGGVARNRDIEDGGRTLSSVAPVVASMGLSLAPHSAYRDFIASEVGR